MNSFLFKDFAVSIWGEVEISKFEELQDHKLINWNGSYTQQSKIQIAMERLSFLLIFDLVKFIGISGSVAARTVVEDDDIDIFVVVKNGTAWIYRFLIWLKNINSKFIRRERVALGNNNFIGTVKDKFCINFIAEERAIDQMGESEFVMHELYSLVPIFNEPYKKYLLYKNDWIVNKFNAVEQYPYEDFKKYDMERKRRNYVLFIINFVMLFGQLTYQMIHLPNLKRVLKNYRKGIIAYFPEEFKGYSSEV